MWPPGCAPRPDPVLQAYLQEHHRTAGLRFRAVILVRFQGSGPHLLILGGWFLLSGKPSLLPSASVLFFFHSTGPYSCAVAPVSCGSAASSLARLFLASSWWTLSCLVRKNSHPRREIAGRPAHRDGLHLSLITASLRCAAVPSEVSRASRFRSFLPVRTAPAAGIFPRCC